MIIMRNLDYIDDDNIAVIDKDEYIEFVQNLTRIQSLKVPPADFNLFFCLEKFGMPEIYEYHTQSVLIAITRKSW